jgi:hypothetical protein
MAGIRDGHYFPRASSALHQVSSVVQRDVQALVGSADSAERTQVNGRGRTFITFTSLTMLASRGGIDRVCSVLRQLALGMSLNRVRLLIFRSLEARRYLNPGEFLSEVSRWWRV